PIASASYRGYSVSVNYFSTGPGPTLSGPLLPAHAGMTPPVLLQFGEASAAPRARGDDPAPRWVRGEPEGCSPRTRG
ncbi:hypothetical protein, partial [Nocardiopsis alba]|uniref:hypothetical protein n=1 Tax=Nocardiopsis alba TaxID=53437 RepID=UPI003F4CB79C